MANTPILENSYFRISTIRDIYGNGLGTRGTHAPRLLQQADFRVYINLRISTIP